MPALSQTISDLTAEVGRFAGTTLAAEVAPGDLPRLHREVRICRAKGHKVLLPLSPYSPAAQAVDYLLALAHFLGSTAPSYQLQEEVHAEARASYWQALHARWAEATPGRCPACDGTGKVATLGSHGEPVTEPCECCDLNGLPL